MGFYARAVDPYASSPYDRRTVGDRTAVVVPCRADGDQLDALLASIARADPVPDLEVVVALHGTGGVVHEIVGRHAASLAVRVVEVPHATGAGAVRNAGAAATDAPRLLFLDSDDEVRPGYLVAMAAALDEHPFVASRVVTEGINPPWAVRIRNPPQRVALGGGHRPWAYGATLGVRREAFDGVGGFDERFPGACAEDVDLCWRIQQAGTPLVYVPDALLDYRLRTDLRGIARQAAAYGRSNHLLVTEHEADGATRPTPWRRVVNVARSIGGAARHPGRGSALAVVYTVSFELARLRAERAARATT